MSYLLILYCINDFYHVLILSNKALNILIAQLKQQKLKHTCYQKMLALAQVHFYYCKRIYRCTYNAKQSKNVSITLAVSAVLFCMIHIWGQLLMFTDVALCTTSLSQKGQIGGSSTHETRWTTVHHITHVYCKNLKLYRLSYSLSATQ